MPHFIILPSSAKDITGERFGKLVALGPVKREIGKHITWLCQCDCGNTTQVRSSSLRSGVTLSCGCLHGENHNKSHDSLYRQWVGVIQRCTNPNSQNYHHYGGRGIRVCHEWLTSFAAYYAHVSRLPNYAAPGHTLDRIDNDGDYEPSNVRWSTHNEQARNTRRNHLITYRNKTQCLMDWATEFDLTFDQLRNRLRRGWPIERALTEPIPLEIKLSEKDIPRIRELYKQGLSYGAIGRRVGVSASMIGKIIRGTSWSHIP